MVAFKGRYWCKYADISVILCRNGITPTVQILQSILLGLFLALLVISLCLASK